MVILALDTTTRGGSAAVARGAAVLASRDGDPTRLHAVRLPADLVTVLDAAGLPLAAVDLFAVACGPGAFTGLRVGLATMQGLAFATGRPVVGISALEALAASVEPNGAPLVGAVMDAARREVFAQLFRVSATPGVPSLEAVDEPAVSPPAEIVQRWRPEVTGRRLLLVGDGALAYCDLLGAELPRATIVEPTPSLAPAVARLGAAAAAAGHAGPPHALRPLYVRRPDAELARDRRPRTRP